MIHRQKTVCLMKMQDTEEDELGGIEIEEPQESGEEIENADDVPIFKKRDSE